VLRLRFDLDRVLMGEGRVLVGPLAEFVGRQVIALLVCHRSGGMGVGGEVMKLGGTVVNTLRHRYLSRGRQLDASSGGGELAN
jgi:hypothetical protein